MESYALSVHPASNFNLMKSELQTDIKVQCVNLNLTWF